MFAAAAAVWQAGAAQESQPAVQPPPATQPSDPQPRREPTADEILEELTRRERAAPRPIVRPAAPEGERRTTVSPDAEPSNAVRPVQTRLIPDGTRLVDRPGRLTREADYYVFTFESRGLGEPELPLRLLPNRLLEDMEVVSAGGSKPVVFIVSGEVTEYHNVNYLLVHKVLTRPDLGNLK